MARSAVMEYKEPEMEADTSMIHDNGMDVNESRDEKTKDEENGDTERSSETMDGVEMSETEVVCKTSANCLVTETLKEMAELLKELGSEIQDLKQKVGTTCSGGEKAEEEDADNGSGAGDESGDGTNEKEEGLAGKIDGTDDTMNEETKCMDDDEGKNEGSGEDDTDEEDEEEKEEGATIPEPTLPPPPESCPPPFQLLASSCYYIQTDSREWRSWGEAQSFCQQQSGTLAASYRNQELREYLQLYYTSVFWVGARYSDPDWVWLNGNKMVEDDWRSGMPSKHPSKLCVYLDYWNNYKGVSHFCGEKFSFICEYRAV
ncbi:C-type lectin-like [Trinorchestia longiramus]|nr:C-type lectin-like [Trinorchestia longiramus]